MRITLLAQPVLGLVEDEACYGFEDVTGDLEPARSETTTVCPIFLAPWSPTTRSYALSK
jgi:hypothetical protein